MAAETERKQEAEFWIEKTSAKILENTQEIREIFLRTGRGTANKKYLKKKTFDQKQNKQRNIRNKKIFGWEICV